MINQVNRTIQRWWWNRSSQTRQQLNRLGIVVLFVVSMGFFLLWTVLAVEEWRALEPDFVTLNAIVLLLVAQLMVTSLFLSCRKNLPWLLKWFGDLNNEFAAALVLSALFLVLVTMPEQRAAEHELKARLIRELHSADNSTARLAVIELRERGWLGDGTLAKVHLGEANLQDVDLGDANLTGTYLGRANLAGTYLGKANLTGAHLWYANLTGAYLWHTDLTGAHLGKANLQTASLRNANLQDVDLSEANVAGVYMNGANLVGAYLWKANLAGAHLREANLAGTYLGRINLAGANLENANLAGANLAGANLMGAHLTDAQFDEDTILPDAEFDRESQSFTSQWTPDTDIARFTDPNHPNFWAADIPRFDTN